MNEPVQNPYAPPVASVSDSDEFGNNGNYIPGGRKVPAGNGVAWLGSAWAMFKESPLPWIGMFVIMMILLIIGALIPFASIVLIPLFVGGVMVACANQSENGSLNIGDLFAGFQNHAGPLCILGLLQTALNFALFIPIIIVGVVVMGAAAVGGMASGNMSGLGIAGFGFGMILLVLLVVAGATLMIMATWFAPALIVHQGLSPFDAMKASFTGCLRNMGSGTIYSLLGLLLGLLMLLTLGLGFLVLGPVLQASIYTAYRDIFVEE